MRPVLPFPLALALLTASHAAHALEFTPEGTLVFDPGAVVTEGFEGAVAPSGVTLRETPEALEGTKIAFVNSKSFQDTLNLSLKLPEDAAYRARMFVRKNRLLADVDVQGGTLEEVSARFYPTGRVTSDGWYEVQTAPFTVQVSGGASATLSVFASGARSTAQEVEGRPPRSPRVLGRERSGVRRGRVLRGAGVPPRRRSWPPAPPRAGVSSERRRVPEEAPRALLRRPLHALAHAARRARHRGAHQDRGDRLGVLERVRYRDSPAPRLAHQDAGRRSPSAARARSRCASSKATATSRTTPRRARSATPTCSSLTRDRSRPGPCRAIASWP
ncbi:MAG: hypothetical protein U0235_27005 [Polyangiaceae bacterium]